MTAQQTTEQPVESLRDLAAQEAVIDLLAARVAAAKKDVRARMQRALDAAAERDGVERIGASLPTGEQVATISLRKGETGPVVTDEEAFTAWVRKQWPDRVEVRLVRTVKEWAASELLGQMDALGLSPAGKGEPLRAAQWPDPDTGELHDVPGVHIKPTRARTHGITWSKGGKDATAQAWRSGALAQQLAAITAGGDAA
jgi:hypothetical protein